MTQETKHTPGPWDIRDRLNCSNNQTTLDICPQYSGTVIANVKNNTRLTATCEANARLIAAAPELLEACENLLSYINSLELDYNPYEGDAAKAIAKAKGEA